MVTAKRKLTDKAIAALKPAAASSRYTVWDAGCLHLGVRVTDKGAKSFIVLKRLPHGRPVVHVLGRYPTTTLGQARSQTPDILRDLEKGITPKAKQMAEARESARRSADTFAVAVARFVEYEQAKKLRTWRSTEAVLRREFLGQKPKGSRITTLVDGHRRVEWKTAWLDGPDPMWRGKPASSIARADIVARLDEIARRNKFAARHALSAVRRLFGWAEEGERFGIVESPAARIRDRLLGITGKHLRRTRVLGDDELRSVWQAAESMSYPFGPLVQLLMLTGQRLKDIAHAEWGEIDRDAERLVLPPDRFKTDVAQEVPLAPKAMEIIEALPTFTGPYLFTTTSGQRPMGGFHKPKQLLMASIAAQRKRDRLAVMPHWVLHDLRRTVRTRLTSDCNVDAFIAERVIGHLLPGLHRVYDQGLHRPQKKAALIAWESCLLAIVDPQPAGDGNVIQLKKRA